MPKLCFERQKSFSSFVLPIRFIDRSECIAIRQNHRTRQTNAFMWLQMDSEYICRLRTHPPEFFWFALHCNEWGHKSSHASEGPAHTHTKWQMRRFDLDIRAIILTTTKKHWKKKRIILAKQKWIIFRHGICCFYWEQIRCEPFTHFFLIQFAKWKSKLIKCYFVRNEKKNSKPLFLFALIQQITNCVRQREGSCSVLNNFLGLPSFSSCERRLNCRTLCFESVFSLLL